MMGYFGGIYHGSTTKRISGRKSRKTEINFCILLAVSLFFSNFAAEYQPFNIIIRNN